jgi:serine/threonine protein phosphatase PrpC
VRIAAGSATDLGRVRDLNEDSLVGRAPLFAVADGMGGQRAGEVASRTAAAVIGDWVDADRPTDGPGLERLLQAANEAIWSAADADPELRGMATTCTLLNADGGVATLAHVGDSRAYLFRDGGLRQLTTDHSVVGELVRSGLLDPARAASHPQRNAILRALGAGPSLEVDVTEVDLAPGDRVLLCTDGLTNMVDEGAIAGILAAIPDPGTAAERLVALANHEGGDDNVTIVIVDIERLDR